MDISAIIIAVLGAGGTFGGFFFGRRTRQAVAVGQELDNMQKAISTWKEIVEFQSKEVIDLRSEINNLKKELINVEHKYIEHIAHQCKTCIYKINAKPKSNPKPVSKKISNG